MRAESKEILTRIPSSFSPVTAGAFFKDKSVLVTGHSDGQVIVWHLDSKDHETVCECQSPVRAIVKSQSGLVAIGCDSGLLIIFNLASPKQQEVVQESSSSVYTRVWRLLWLSNDALLSSSTYGSLKVWRRVGTGWNFETLEGHEDSIFGLAEASGLIVMGDYKGKITVWRKHGGSLSQSRQILSTGNIQNATVAPDGSFATITSGGRIRYFEHEADAEDWGPGFLVDTATGQGISVHFAEDKETIFGGTDSELIQFDIENELVQHIPLGVVRAVFSDSNHVYALTNTGFVRFERSPVEAKVELVKYQYAKVSLIGRTSVGKSTFCASILGQDVMSIKSTLGRIIQPWILESKTLPERRIILHDHGGQETVLGSFLPFLADSDLILVFFSQKDKNTWEKAEELVADIQSIISSRTKIALVRTFIDEVQEVGDALVASMMKRYPNIIGCYGVDPKHGEGMEKMKQVIIKAIPWSEAPATLQSQSIQTVESVVLQLQQQGKPIVNLSEVKEWFEKVSSSVITKGHLRFILKGLASQGVIEYYPELYDAIIFNDPDYNRLKSEIPFYVYNNNGKVSIEELRKLGNPLYVNILDQIYTEHGLAIENQEQRVFPNCLPARITELPPTVLKLLDENKTEGKLTFIQQKTRTGPLMDALSRMNMRCLLASKTGGIFAWEKNACIYYEFNEAGNALLNRTLELTYYIGGQREQMCERLAREFDAVARQIYGPTK